MKKNLDGYKMSETQLIHATLIEYAKKGVLLRGKSNCGKSDLALRLIMNKNARLVADDIVILSNENNQIIGKAPDNLRGLLEVRGIGIVKLPYVEQITINLIADLVENDSLIERMPKDAQENIFGVEIKKIDLYAKENSAPDKVLLKLDGSIVQEK